MKLIFIYGPPAVGKLTVATELSKITNYKVFHNQLTVDLLNSLLKFGSESYFKLSDKIRLELLEEAAKEKINGVIFTYCYVYKEDDAWVKKLIKTMKKQNSSITFVHLIADKKELRKRVKSESRKKHDKVKTIKLLNECLNKWERFKPIPFVKSLEIDNSNISAKEVAEIIKKELK